MFRIDGFSVFLPVSFSLAAIAIVTMVSLSDGQVLPSGVLDAPPLVIGDNQSIDTDTTLNIAEGGVVGNTFHAGLSDRTSRNVVVNMTGGQIGQGLHTYAGSTLNISGGSIGRDMRSYRDSVVNLSGGTISSGYILYQDSQLNIDGGWTGSLTQYGGEINLSAGSLGSFSNIFGGTLNIDGGVTSPNTAIGSGGVVNIYSGKLGWRARALNRSTVNLFGGLIDTSFDALNDSVVNIYGGQLGGGFYAGGGSEVFVSGGRISGGFETRSSSSVEFSGADFRVDGVPLTGFDNVGDTQPFNLPFGSVLTGTYSDGTPFAFTSREGDSIADGSLTLKRTELATVPSVFNVPTDTAPSGVRAGQTLNLNAGGTLPAVFGAGWGSEVNIAGGDIGGDFEAAGATVNISGGLFAGAYDAFHATTTNLSGGNLGSSASFVSSTFNMTGGRLGNRPVFADGSTARVAGGTIDDRLELHDGSSLTLVGNEFRIDGVLVLGLETDGTLLQVTLPSTAVLSGTLADGTPIAISGRDGDSVLGGTVTLEAANLPAIGPSMIDAATEPVPLGIRSGQTLTVGTGSQVPLAFNAGRGSRVEVVGGEVGNNLEAVAAEVLIESGSVGSSFDAYDGTTVTMTGGTLGSNASVYSNSTFKQSGGAVSSLSAIDGGTLTIGGDSTNGSVYLRESSTLHLEDGSVSLLEASESTVNISGGLILGRTTLDLGTVATIAGGRLGDGLSIVDGASVTLLGGEFYLDGMLVGGLNSTGDSATVNVGPDSVLSGTLADGTPFAFGKGFRTNDSIADGTVTLERSELPAIGPAVITLSDDNAPLGLRSGQTLFVEAGGVVADNVTVGLGSAVHVLAGGEIGENFEAVGATIMVDGGTIGTRLDLFDDAMLTMTSGELGAGGSSAHSVNVYGGELNLHGGKISTALIAADEAEVNLFGYGFAIGGVLLEDLILDEDFTITDRSGTKLTGYLSDGTPIDLDLRESSGRINDAFSLDTTLTVTLVVPDNLPGDYNADGVVDAADYTVWRNHLGTSTPLANESVTFGEVTEEDFLVWRSQFGATRATSSVNSETIPEPGTVALLTILMLFSNRSRLRKTDSA